MKLSSKIIGIQFSIQSPEEIRKSSVVKIESRDTYINNKPVIGGMFDPRMGVLESGLLCPTDGLNHIETPGYFGHIDLAKPVFYIQYFNQVMKILRCVCLKCSSLMIDKEKHKYVLELPMKQRWDIVSSIAMKKDKDKICDKEGCGCNQPKKIKKEDFATIVAEWDSKLDDDNENYTLNITPEIALKILKRITDDDIIFMGYHPLFSRPEWMICQVLAVPPPCVRPSIKHDSQQRSEDDLSYIIMSILKVNEDIKKKLQVEHRANVIEDCRSVLQYYCAALVNNKIPGVDSAAQRSGRAFKSITDRLNGKTGRVRGNLMGKRVDFSARSVISGDPNLSIRQLGVPIKIAKNITYPIKVNKRNMSYLSKLVRNGPDVYPGANILHKKNGNNISLKYIDRDSIQLQEGDIVHRHVMDGDPVLFNRQPTLHRMSMMCHIVKVLKKGNTFRMNVADTKPYNADFDGDEMNMHMPQDEESSSELRHLAAVPYHIISPASNGTIIGIFQDSLLGLYRFTRENIKFDALKAMRYLVHVKDIQVKSIKENMTNMSLLSEILPSLSLRFKNNSFDDDEDKKTSNNIVEIKNGKMIRGQLDKSVKNIIHSINNDYGSMACSDFIDAIQNIVTEYMKTSSYSVGISDLIADKETNMKISDSLAEHKQKVKDIYDKTLLGTFDNASGQTNQNEFENQINTILNSAREEAGTIGIKNLDQNNRFVIMVNAGSKGSPINITQMISCLGQQNVDNKRIPYGFESRTLPHYKKFDDSPEARGFVEHSFIHGLTPQELFFHAMGGRVGLIDTAVKTSQTGYIQRRLIKGMEDLKVEYDMTVRNNMRKIIQFNYGDDGMDTTKVETINIGFIYSSMEDIYSHCQLPNIPYSDELYTTTFQTNTMKRLKNQEDELKIKAKELIDRILETRKKIIKYVFHNEYKNKVYAPVQFERCIHNIKNQLKLRANTLVNITPLECMNIVEKYKKRLRGLNRCEPTPLFEILYDYFISPKQLLVNHHFNKKAVHLLCEIIEMQYKKAIIAPGEMVGMIAAQSIGEPTTQLTLNTFHFAGVSSKSTVTRGVPRIEEILSLSKDPKNPSVTIYMKPENQQNKDKTEQIKNMIEHTSLRELVESAYICFDPDRFQTTIEEDRDLVEQHREYEKIMNHCEGFEDNKTQNSNQASKWVLRMVLDKEIMFEKNITMDDVHFAIENSFQEIVDCVYTDFNSDKLVCRIRIQNKMNGSSKSDIDPLDQHDQIHMLKEMQDNILDQTVLRGVKKITKVHMRKVQNNVSKTNGIYEKNSIWVLDTVGSNLLSILAMDVIDDTRTYSTNIIEMYEVLGIEAVRNCIYNEIVDVIEHSGSYINSHHIDLLCDRMCSTVRLVSIFRHGINNDHIGPIAKASFE